MSVNTAKDLDVSVNIANGLDVSVNIAKSLEQLCLFKYKKLNAQNNIIKFTHINNCFK